MTNLAVRYIRDRPVVLSDKQVLPEMMKGKTSNIYYMPFNALARAKIEAATGEHLPLMTSYEWPSPPDIKPYKHQRITAEFLVSHLRCWCLNGMRSGKTMATLWAIDFLFRSRMITKVLIMAPLTILEDVWRSELFMITPHRSVYIANESIDDLIHAMKYADYDIIVVNHDKIKFATQSIIDWDPDLIVCDEAGGFRYWNTERSKALAKLCNPIKRGFWALTATPTPQSPTDVWPLARIISPHRVPKSFRKFEDMVLTRCPFTRRTTERPGADKIVQDALHPAILYKTADCIDLPEQGYVTRRTPLTKQQDKAINELKKTAVSIIHDMESGEDAQIVAANAAVVAGKIIQVLGGVVRDGEGKPRIVGANQRIKELISVLDEVGNEKVIVMCNFTAIQPYIQKQLAKNKIGSVILNGSINAVASKRAAVLDSFRTDPDTRVIIAHPKCAQFGLNLSIANTTIWYVPTYRSEEWQQSNQRMVAAKSAAKQKTTVVRLSSGAIEDRLYAKLNQRELSQDNIIGIFRALVDTNDQS